MEKGTPSNTAVEPAKSSPKMKWIWIGLTLIVVLGVLLSSGEWIGSQLPVFESWIMTLGWWGFLIFIILFTILSVFQFPESILAISAGVIWGIWEGFMVVSIANVVGAAVGFWVYRSILRNRVHGMLLRHPRLHIVEEAVSERGFKLMFLLRLGPFSYSILNGILGASDVRFRPFMLSLVGAFPGNFATVYFGTVAMHLAQKSAGVDDLNQTHELIMVAGLGVTLVVCFFIARVARRALKQAELESHGAI